MKAFGNDMMNKKMLKIITLSLTFWASFVVSTQTLAREKCDPKNYKEMVMMSTQVPQCMGKLPQQVVARELFCKLVLMRRQDVLFLLQLKSYS